MRRRSVGLIVGAAAMLLIPFSADADPHVTRSVSEFVVPLAFARESIESKSQLNAASRQVSSGPSGTLSNYTLFRYGGMAVQPVVGRVNGAQLSFSW